LYLVIAMKLLHLLRHAKSDWGDSDLGDHGRPLSPRGVAAAKTVARHLAAEDFTVDAVFCSTARRARETWALLERRLGKVSVSFCDDLYLVSIQDVLEVIRRAPESAESIMIVGHNPTTHDLALRLVARAAAGQRPALAQLADKYPTGALCTIKLAVTRWRDVAPGKGTLTRFLRPRDLALTPQPRTKASRQKVAMKETAARPVRRRSTS
jgi:phosphohistidine phosphatase